MLDKEIMMLPQGVDKEGRTLLLMQPGYYYPSSVPLSLSLRELVPPLIDPFLDACA